MPEQSAMVENIMSEIHGLNSKVQVIVQRMKIIERNEEIIGKTLITHNKMLKEIEEEINKLKSGGFSVDRPSDVPDTGLADEVKGIARDAKKQMEQNRKEIELIKSELAEIKYVLDTINPVAYATVDQVADLIDEKIERLKKKG
jgi:DNA repair exonuclease SbcCD ATPase subunit